MSILESMLTYDDIAQRFVRWAQAQPDLRAILVIGSRARTQTPADRWSDLDLILVTTAPHRYLNDTDWLAAVGPYWLTFTEPTATGGLIERRVLFEDALDVDFVPLPLERFKEMLYQGIPAEVEGVFARGFRFVLDKDDLAKQVRLSDAGPTTTPPPSEGEFLNLVNDFWYHAVWTAKKLLRGELWTSLGGHAYMRSRALLPMLAWHAKAQRGWDFDTWHGGRFLEKWADARAVEALPKVFAHHDQEDFTNSLFATMRLFGWLAQETAKSLEIAYPHEAERQVVRWVGQELGVSE
jgi:aminoglycoside 6-adenylyltransferase